LSWVAETMTCDQAYLLRCIQKFPDWVYDEVDTTTINPRWEATQSVMATKLTRLTHKIAIQLHLVAESCTICSSHFRRLVRKLLDKSSYAVLLDIFPKSQTGKYLWPVRLSQRWRFRKHTRTQTIQVRFSWFSQSFQTIPWNRPRPIYPESYLIRRAYGPNLFSRHSTLTNLVGSW
jgi:hypothetical protein